MIRLKVANALLFCSILSAGPAFAARTIDITADAPSGAAFSPLDDAGTANMVFQRNTLSPMEQLAALDYLAPGEPGAVSLELTPPAEVSGSVWLVGAGFGTIFLVAARRRRPDVQGV